MATNPDELLIFKLRGMSKKVETKTESAPKPEVKIEQPKAIVAPKAVPRPVEAPKAAPQKPAESGSYFNLFKKQEEKPTITSRLEEKALMESVTKQAPQVQKVVEQPAPEMNRKVMESEREQMEAAAGLNCVNHPWRSAYALSAYSKMPYCYADLVEYSDKFYSIDDIDKVAGKEDLRARPMNSFIKIASAIFVVNSLILFYFTLPQLSFIAAYISGVAPSTALGTFSSTYSIPLFNLVISILGFLAGILILLTEERGIYLSALVGTIMLMGVSFEYLDSYLPYLLGVSLLSLLEIAMLAYGRVSATTTSYSRDIVAPDIDWPRVETF
ncbi:MAG: hypothetical protein KGH53_02525 [Candidatus Micrarchaeota archaeon]|nr:hypothetical protein [Candidatus Micrarchaeota archaeon]